MTLECELGFCPKAFACLNTALMKKGCTLMTKRGLASWVGSATIVVLLMVTLGGCTKHIEIQKSHVVDDPLLPRLTMDTPVDLVIDPHPTTGIVKFCDPTLGAATLEYADLTAYMTQSLTDIFARNQIAVAAGAPKRLRVGIVEASCDEEPTQIRFDVKLSVAAGDRPARTFTGFQRTWSAHGFNFSVTAATLNAVLEMFKDPDIRAYLEDR
jgi:hypothetical protein